MSVDVFFDVSNRVGWLEGQGHRKSFGGRDLLPISVLNFYCRHRAEKGICVSWLLVVGEQEQRMRSKSAVQNTTGSCGSPGESFRVAGTLTSVAAK